MPDARSPKDTFITVYGRMPVLEVLQDDSLTVDKVLVARALPGEDARIEPSHQEYFLLVDGSDVYLTNVIREQRGFQQILRVDALYDVAARRSPESQGARYRPAGR